MQFLLVLILISLGAIAETRPVSDGIVVLFKEASEAQKNSLHQKLNATLTFRSELLNMDQLSAPQNAETLCQEYVKENIVQYCEVLFELAPPSIVNNECNDTELHHFLEPLQKIMNNFNPSECELVPSAEAPKDARVNPHLSLLWAQEQIGNDLVKEELKTTTEITHALFDSGYDFKTIEGHFSGDLKNKTFGHDVGHGTKTANLLNSPSQYGIAVDSKITHAVDGYSGDYLKSFETLIRANAAITTLEINTLCQLSACAKTMGANTHGKVSQTLIRKLTERSVVVAAAGNFHPEGSKDNIASSDVIIVGSSEPYGTVSWYSDESTDVTILAPSGGSGVAVKKKESYEQYPGTSGAAPLVSGSLSNVMQVLGTLSQREAKTLLQKTATKTVATDIKPQKNGAGVLNSYKMFKVSQRLKEKGWPANKESLLNDPGLYHFKNEAKEHLNLAKKLIEKGSCQDMRDAFKEARKAFLLNQDEESGKLVEEFYRSLKYFQNASFYSNLDKTKLKSYLEANMKGDKIHPSIKRAHSMLERAK